MLKQLKCYSATWELQTIYIVGQEVVKVKIMNDRVEKVVKLMGDFHGLLTKDGSQNTGIYIYPNCKKDTLK